MWTVDDVSDRFSPHRLMKELPGRRRRGRFAPSSKPPGSRPFTQANLLLSIALVMVINMPMASLSVGLPRGKTPLSTAYRETQPLAILGIT
jgi:hypothetical protein